MRAQRARNPLVLYMIPPRLGARLAWPRRPKFYVRFDLNLKAASSPPSSAVWSPPSFTLPVPFHTVPCQSLLRRAPFYSSLPTRQWSARGHLSHLAASRTFPSLSLSLLLPRHSRFFPRSCLRRHHPPPSPLHHSSPSHLLAPSYNGEAGQAARLSSFPAGRADVLVTLPAMAPHGHPPSLPGALPACASSAPFLPTARSPAMAARPSPLPAPSLSPSPVAGHDRTAHGEAGALLPPNAAVARAGHCSRRRAPDRLGCRLILRFYGIPVCTSKDFNEVSLQVHVSVTFMNLKLVMY